MNILIIEDYKSVGQIIDSILEAYNHRTTFISSNQIDSVLHKISIFDFVIMDICLKQNSSEKILELLIPEMRTGSILGISTKGTWKDRVEFLKNGGDDVLNYPFPIQELLARIKNLSNRAPRISNRILRVKNIELDTDLKQAYVDDKDVPLRRREYSLLEYMVKNRNRTVTRNELLDKVWDYRRSIGSNTVDVHVKRLRDKLKDRELIETVHGFGYTLKDPTTPRAS